MEPLGIEKVALRRGKVRIGATRNLGERLLEEEKRGLEPLGTWEVALGREIYRFGATRNWGRGSRKRKREVWSH